MKKRRGTNTLHSLSDLAVYIRGVSLPQTLQSQLRSSCTSRSPNICQHKSSKLVQSRSNGDSRRIIQWKKAVISLPQFINGKLTPGSTQPYATTEPGFTILIRAHLLYCLKSWREELGSGMKRKYPRATLRRIMKSKRNINISKSADLAVSSSYFFFNRGEKNRSFVSIAGPATLQLSRELPQHFLLSFFFLNVCRCFLVWSSL